MKTLSVQKYSRLPEIPLASVFTVVYHKYCHFLKLNISLKQCQRGLFLDRWRFSESRSARWVLMSYPLGSNHSTAVRSKPIEIQRPKPQTQYPIVCVALAQIFLVLFLLHQEFCLYSRTQPLSLSLSKSESSRSSSPAKAVRRWILYLRS